MSSSGITSIDTSAEESTTEKSTSAQQSKEAAVGLTVRRSSSSFYGYGIAKGSVARADARSALCFG